MPSILIEKEVAEIFRVPKAPYARGAFKGSFRLFDCLGAVTDSDVRLSSCSWVGLPP